jgi:hypothetical protein
MACTYGKSNRGITEGFQQSRKRQFRREKHTTNFRGLTTFVKVDRDQVGRASLWQHGHL